MPITGIASYPPTMREFELHWEAVDAADVANPLVLPPNYVRGNFLADEAAVNAAMTAVTQAATAARGVALDSQTLKMQMRERVGQFRMTVHMTYPGSSWDKRAPAMPKPNSIETKFMEPFDEVAQLWDEINASGVGPGLPLILPGNYTRSDLDLNILALHSSFQDVAASERHTQSMRDDRDELLKPIYDRMLQYRTAVVLHLPANSPLLQSIPRLSPIPGTTPPGLDVTGIWENVQNKAYLSWPASDFHDLQKLQVRGCTGSVYKSDDEEIVDDLDKAATSYATDWGLTAPGALATFKVYVMATTGNENGGKAVKIVRPVT